MASRHTICLRWCKKNKKKALTRTFTVMFHLWPSVSAERWSKWLRIEIRHCENAQTCVMQTWTAPLCHCQWGGETTVVSVANEGRPAAHSWWYVVLDVRYERCTYCRAGVWDGCCSESKSQVDLIFGWGIWTDENRQEKRDPWEMKTLDTFCLQ